MPSSDNLPHQLTSFVGRDLELTEVCELIRTTPLLTLIGAGGSGKTRLALQAAGLVAGEFEGGAWLVELASLVDPSLVTDRVAGVLGVRASQGSTVLDGIASRVGDVPTFLILDNCEHLLAACAELAAELVSRCPELRLVATSRQPLGLPAERVWSVPPLMVPPRRTEAFAAYESVRLFADRAALVRRDFRLDDHTAKAVAEICRRLDGIPLAIELAAARTNVLSCNDLASRLEDRFRLLRTPQRGRPARHQTLEALIDWSYELLSKDEQSLMRSLSVFAGGFTIDTAAQAAQLDQARLVDLLGSLIDKSLVIRSGGSRYIMLETIRGYAWKKAGEAGTVADVRANHAQLFLFMAEEARPHLEGSQQAEWLERLEQDHDNLLQALAWFEDDENAADCELRMAYALVEFWKTRGHWKEGTDRLARALRRDASERKLRIWGLKAQGQLSHALSDYDSARALYEEALELSEEIDDPRSIADTSAQLALISYVVGDLDDARSRLENCAAFYRSIGESRNLGAALSNLGSVTAAEGRWHDARSHFEECLAEMRKGHDGRAIGLALLNLAGAENETGDQAAARRHLEEALTLAQTLGDKALLISIPLQLGFVSRAEGNVDAARQMFEQSLAGAREQGDREVAAESLVGLGWVACDRGDPTGARSRFEEALALAQGIGNNVSVAKALEGLDALAKVPSSLEPLAAPPSVFRREAEYWTVEHLGRTVRLKDSKGLRYIAHLLAHPGREFHAFDLLAAVDGLPAAGPRIAPTARLGPQVREAALRRVGELRAELEEAEVWSDTERAAAAKLELDELLARLAGTEAKRRGVATDADRARWAVSKLVTRAIKQIAAGHPELGEHLKASVRTGLFCGYAPGRPVGWSVTVK